MYIDTCQWNCLKATQSRREVSLSAVIWRWLIACTTLLLCLAFGQQPAKAQSAYPFVQSDIGSPGATGTYSPGPPTYQVQGAGTGIGGTADSFTYASEAASGNIEIYGKISSLSPTTSNYATAGFMLRNATAATSADAYISVSPTNGINFTTRSAAGAASNTTLGPTLSAPVWLRLVVSGNSVAGYYAADGLNWTLVGRTTMTLPTTYQVGMATSSNVNNTLITAQFTNVNLLTNVPQRASNMLLWLRSDVGVQYSGTAVSGWQDQSSNGFTFTQSSSSNQPTLVGSDSSANGLPALQFNGSAEYLSLGTGPGPNVTSGVSVFIIQKPTTFVTGKRLIEFSTATNNRCLLYEDASKPSLYVQNNGNTAQQLIGSTVLNTGNYELVEATQDSSNNTNLYRNGVANGSGSVQVFTTSGQTSNLIGASLSGVNSTYCYAGNICEILVYSGAVDSTTRQSIENYVFSKYNMFVASTPSAPTITPSGGVTPLNTVTISGAAGTQLWYTTDGATPVVGHTDTQAYAGPFLIPIGSTTTVKAIATVPFALASSVTTAAITPDSTAAGVPKTYLAGWWRSDITVTSGSNVTQWTDLSGQNNTATQSNVSKQPQLITNAINGLPALSFSSSSQTSLSVPNSFYFDYGATVFVVAKPGTISSGGTATMFSSSYAQDQTFSILNNSNPLYALNLSSTGGASVQANNIVPINGAQLLEYSIPEGNNTTGSLFQNGTLVAQNGGMYSGNNPGTVTAIGFDVGTSGNYFNGQIAEVLIYGTGYGPLSSGQRQMVEQYLIKRYDLSPYPSLSFSVPSNTTFQVPAQVAISSSPGATIYYSNTGPATTSSPVYSSPINVAYSQTIYALAVSPSGIQTSALATYTLDPTRWPAPPATDTTAPKINIQVPTPAQ